jgi:hypothetical protein
MRRRAASAAGVAAIRAAAGACHRSTGRRACGDAAADAGTARAIDADSCSIPDAAAGFDNAVPGGRRAAERPRDAARRGREV